MTQDITISSETESKLGTIAAVADLDEPEEVIGFLADRFLRKEVAGVEDADEADIETTRKGTVDLRE